jgi:hypothetical protein
LKNDSKDELREQTTTVTFRIKKKIIDSLCTESKKKNISLNTLITQILNGYMEWEQYATVTGMVALPRSVVGELFQRMNENEVVYLAENIGRKAMLDVAFFMNDVGDLNSFLKWFEIRMRNSSVQVNRTVQNNITNYVFKHDMGKNWSLYYKTILEAVMRDLFHNPMKVIASDSILKFSINS